MPLWAFLMGILATASVTAGLLIVPTLLSAKPDFSISLDTTSMNLIPSGNGNLTLVTIQPIRNFTGIISVEATTSGTGISASLNDVLTNGVKDTVLLGKAATLQLRVLATMPGNYTTNVIASCGNISHKNPIRVSVQNLTMIATPKAQDIPRGSSGTAKIDLISVNRLGGNLSLQDSIIIKATGYPDQNSFAPIPASVILQPGETLEIVMIIRASQAAQTGARTVVVEASKATWNFVLTFTFNIV